MRLLTVAISSSSVADTVENMHWVLLYSINAIVIKRIWIVRWSIMISGCHELSENMLYNITVWRKSR